MNQDEIISFLRMQKANDPDAYDKYMAEYKEKNPDFYKTVLIPALEPQITQKKTPETINMNVPNPVETLASDLQPLGSANVGELNYESSEQEAKKTIIQTPKPENTSANPDSKPVSGINRKKPPIKMILIIAGIVIVVVVVIALLVFR